MALTPLPLDHLRVHARATRSIRRTPALILSIAIVAIALVIDPATTSKADESYCGQVADLAAARLRWAAARQSRVDPVPNEKKCRTYGIHFYDAVTALILGARQCGLRLRNSGKSYSCQPGDGRDFKKFMAVLCDGGTTYMTGNSYFGC